MISQTGSRRGPFPRGMHPVRPIGRGIQPRRRLAHSTPHFLFHLAEKKMGRGRSKRKGRFFAALRCSGPPRGRGSPESVPAKPPAFCRLAPDRSFSPAPSRVFGAAVIGVENHMAAAPLSAAAGPAVDGGLCNGPMRVSAPTDTFPAGSFVGADVHIRPLPHQGPGSA